MGGKIVKTRNIVELILQCGALIFLLFDTSNCFYLARAGGYYAYYFNSALIIDAVILVLACVGIVMFIVQLIDKVKCYNLTLCVIISIVELALSILGLLLSLRRWWSTSCIIGCLIALVILSAIGYYRTNPKIRIREMGAYFKRAGENTKTDSTHPVIQESADDLQKYKNLLDEGAITQEEFDVKKKQILNL